MEDDDDDTHSYMEFSVVEDDDDETLYEEETVYDEETIVSQARASFRNLRKSIKIASVNERIKLRQQRRVQPMMTIVIWISQCSTMRPCKCRTSKTIAIMRHPKNRQTLFSRNR